MPTDSFEAVAEFVENELDFPTSHYDNSYLDRRFRARLRRTDASDYRAYLSRLRSDPNEQMALLNTLSINVTEFFRNPPVWEGIRPRLRELTDGPKRATVWSAACADGREPYSLAMLAHSDPKITSSRLRITATDINDQALAVARDGTYQQTQTTDLDDQLGFLEDYTQYVDRSSDRVTINPSVQRLVTFEQHDLINDAPKPGHDMVLCRNLFIYIDTEYKLPVLNTVTDSLRPGGYLVIGKAETIPTPLQSQFTPVASNLRIYEYDPSDT